MPHTPSWACHSGWEAPCREPRTITGLSLGRRFLKGSQATEGCDGLGFRKVTLAVEWRADQREGKAVLSRREPRGSERNKRLGCRGAVSLRW